jgi:hypothetical protein
MLAIMSGMYPHTISWNLGWFWFGQSCWLGQSTTVELIGMFDVELSRRW